uniref:Uncharacterized protein n=1 Tax=Myotis myotis TaxID=51298 RepID=A0A7J7VIT9_MYOMY|nr:hypothetical protein mMyoMyo1_008370 [Myotis myotis]
MALPRHTQSRAHGERLGHRLYYPQSRADQGVGAPHPVTHRAAGRSGCWGAPPYQAQSRADQGVGVPSPVTKRAGRIGRLWPRPLSHTEPQGDQGVWALPPVTLILMPGGLAAPLIPVLGGI